MSSLFSIDVRGSRRWQGHASMELRPGCCTRPQRRRGCLTVDAAAEAAESQVKPAYNKYRCYRPPSTPCPCQMRLPSLFPSSLADKACWIMLQEPHGHRARLHPAVEAHDRARRAGEAADSVVHALVSPALAQVPRSARHPALRLVHRLVRGAPHALPLPRLGGAAGCACHGTVHACHLLIRRLYMSICSARHVRSGGEAAA